MENPDKKVPWYYQPWAVVMSLFLVLGPFGLPLLYRSPKFSRTAKIVLTIATVAYTVYLVIATIELAQKMSGALIGV